MYAKQTFWSDDEYPRKDEARSIGSVLNSLREIDVLREKARMCQLRQLTHRPWQRAA